MAWTFSLQDRDSIGNHSQNQCTPIMIDGVLYASSPRMKLFALDGATGEQKWVFDPASLDTGAQRDPFAFFKVSRGVAYWQNDAGTDKRLFFSVGQKTYCINAEDGKPITSFGKDGFIDLTENLDRDPTTFNPFVAGTTPGIIYQDLLIIGARVAESADAAPGHLRAYNVHTGKRKWIFHTIPHPGELNYNTWPDKQAYKKLGGANSWGGLSLDEKRGIVYVPTGSIGGDFYGGMRKGSNLYANSLVALNAATGKYLWHFQMVHHDLWDRDLPTNPNLVTLHKDGKAIAAVAQITKHGYVFLFDRVTGEPLFPIKEVPVPQKALIGEKVWPTQPIPTLPEPFARQNLGPDDFWVADTSSKKKMMAQFKKIKNFTPFTPPGKDGVWIYPGFDGGGEWGGAAVDPESGIMYVNSSEAPWSLTMVDLKKAGKNDKSPGAAGRSVYNKYCTSCHGPQLKGNGSNFPSLVNIGKKYDENKMRLLLENGRNMMPPFKQISAQDKKILIAFLVHNDMANPTKKATIAAAAKEPATAQGSVPKEPGAQAGATPVKKSILDEVPYTMTGYNKFVDKNGYPGIKPPWGTLNAVDLNSGKLLWKVPLGEFEELTKKGIPITGTQVYGGPAVTKGGLVFVASTQDEKIRAFDKKTGNTLWEAKLPAAGYATPSVYLINGKEYIVIACGGGKLGSKSGDQYVAFAL
uniref:PQQ-dependent glucose dehydrogenase n=1 Tax=uncultured bacterium BLR12 TaxID=506514 RepID=C0IND4_9BACT|nr:PQQ-dependent glucose dehydrogenase [uncultured bacterium BLR12]